ncbi:MAG TPA: winged helix-turn-helix domain-containing protein [Caulobacteraceae bacterium]
MAAQRPFEFGGWRVDPARGALIAEDGAETRLEPKQMDLLVMFAGAGGRVLSKDEIVAAVWDGRAIGDDTLAAAVSRLRRALGETPEHRFIETAPKRGYRAVVADAPAGGAAASVADPGPPEAARLVEQGRRALASPLPSSHAQARLSFEAAIAAAPGWAPAHQGLADTLIARHFVGQGEGELAAAKASAHAAVGLDPDAASAWATLGLALLLADRDFAAADAAFQRAIALAPELAPAHRRRAFAFAAVGRFVEAERAARQAVELQPSSLEARRELVELLLAARRYRHAAAEAAAVLSLAPQSSDAWYARGWALSLAGDEAEGMAALLRGLALWSGDPAQADMLSALYAREGRAATLRAAADLFAAQPAMFLRRTVDIAILRALGGQPDAAFAALDQAAARDDPVLLLFPSLPYFDALKSDPGYDAFVSRLRLVR